MKTPKKPLVIKAFYPTARDEKYSKKHKLQQFLNHLANWIISSGSLDEIPLRGRAVLQVSLHFVSEAEMTKLNFVYRGKKKTTDVLSFPLVSRLEKQSRSQLQVHLGELAINLKQATAQFKEQNKVLSESVLQSRKKNKKKLTQTQKLTPTQSAKSYWSLTHELQYLVLHGFLHLLGLDHEEKGRQKKKRLVIRAAKSKISKTELAQTGMMLVLQDVIFSEITNFPLEI